MQWLNSQLCMGDQSLPLFHSYCREQSWEHSLRAFSNKFFGEGSVRERDYSRYGKGPDISQGVAYFAGDADMLRQHCFFFNFSRVQCHISSQPLTVVSATFSIQWFKSSFTLMKCLSQLVTLAPIFNAYFKCYSSTCFIECLNL